MAPTVIIVGGTSGMGLAAARLLAHQGARVIATGRDLSRFGPADRDAGIHPVRLDLGQLDNVRSFTADYARLGDPDPDVVLLNAGQQTTERTWSEDGYEATMAVNVLAPLLLLDGLLPRLAPGSRVVWTSSGTHNPAEVKYLPGVLEQASLAELVHPAAPFAKGDGMRWYATSKLSGLRCVAALAPRLRERGVAINSFDPGLMPGTGLARGYSPRMRRAWTALTPVLLMAPGAHRPQTSARHLAGLALDPRYAAMSGAYIVDEQPAGMSIAAHDLNAAESCYADARTLIGAQHLPG